MNIIADLNEFFVRAKTVEKMEEIQQLNKLSQFREEDLQRLQRQRQERIRVYSKLISLLYLPGYLVPVILYHKSHSMHKIYRYGLHALALNTLL